MRKPVFAAIFITSSFLITNQLFSIDDPIDQEPMKPSILIRSLQGSPDTLDPHTALGIHPLSVLRDLFESLVNASPENQPIPGVAEKWEISKDGRTYTFHLRNDAKWSDGSLVTAEDFVYSWQRCVNPLTASPKASLFNILKNGKEIICGKLQPTHLGVKAINPTTLEVELIAPYPYFLNMLSHNVFFPLPKHLLESHGRNFARPNILISNGPFTSIF